MLEEIEALCAGPVDGDDHPPALREVDCLRLAGSLEAAERAAHRFLSRDPYVPDGHDVLARIYLALDDAQGAHDEWSTALRLDAHHRGALRGLAQLAVRRLDLSSCERFLRELLHLDPRDAMTARALGQVELVMRDDTALPGRRDAATAPRGMATVPAVDAPAPVGLADPGLVAVLFVDEEGLVVEDRSPATSPDAAMLGAVLSGLAGDADRTLADLGLGRWDSLTAECEHGSVAMAPVHANQVVIVAAESGFPLGMLRRSLARIRDDVGRQGGAR